MFPLEIWLAYTAACLLLVLSPGPDNLLAIGRGLSQGKRAAMGSGVFRALAFCFTLLRRLLG